MTDPFALLGLKRDTASEADVKAAYARLLKTTRPEDDRAAFMALRDAFTRARGIAKINDQRPAPAPEPIAQKPAAPPAEPIKWTHYAGINWNCQNTPKGDLVKKTLEWMIASGPDPEAFVRAYSETIIAAPDIDARAFRFELLDFILARSDREDISAYVNDWEMYEVKRPDWLSDEVMGTLHRDIQLFKDKPTDTWRARGYNILLEMFAPVLDVPIAPIDAAAIFAEEENNARKDDHGSFFEKEKMTWIDMSPVGVAMRDVQEAIDRGLWDIAETCKKIFARDNLQPIDEFQTLDARMRNLICNATGWHTKERKLVYPAWLNADMVILLDRTFGWSRHFGRHNWERQQFNWLHKVLARNIKPDGQIPQFSQATVPLQPARPAQREPNSFTALLARVYARPHELLLGYFGFRLLQFIVRLAT